MKFLVNIIFILFFSIYSYGQNITVLSKSDGQPIPDVTIYNVSKSKSAITNFDGIADIGAFSADEELYFSHVSHLSKSFLKSDIEFKNN